ncbi:hypothetical protein [Lentibacillus sp. CBA3610]|uniref:hypothetical protein n=1 Tax=Lentibacillus sp. CBA3610 TaxID=2518176 RepID=UPI00159573A7|nr:hypothetical protein [Lentibacillus sp. CBA3610]QKY71313.1 hypothetical protein Len3610_18715 [Lentibacillus sp. CBA3610]
MNEYVLEESLREEGKITIEPLKQWYCDNCEEIIQSADKGWLEWLRNINDDKEYNFRIVHHSSECMYDDRNMKDYVTKDMHLQHYTGADGLSRLLEILLRNKVDSKEVVHIIRRLHAPFYEQSLLYRDVAKEDNYFSGDPELYFTVSENLNIIKEYAIKNSY